MQIWQMSNGGKHNVPAHKSCRIEYSFRWTNGLVLISTPGYVLLVSNGWLASWSNSNIRKSAPAGERHVFGIWGIGQFHNPYSR